MMKIEIETTEHNTAILMAIDYLNNGFIIKEAYVKKRFFKQPLYFIALEEGAKNYPHEIEKAVNDERYEDARKLKTEFECNEVLLREIFEKQLKSQQKIHETMFK